MTRRLKLALGGALLGAAFYLLLIDTRELPELYVIPAVALLCGGATALGSGFGLTDAVIRPRWLIAAWRPMARILPDVGLVLYELLAQLRHPCAGRGELRVVRFDTGGGRGNAHGRIGLTEALGSLAPNTIVVGVDGERGLLIVHQLRRHGEGRQLDPLRLG